MRRTQPRVRTVHLGLRAVVHPAVVQVPAGVLPQAGRQAGGRRKPRAASRSLL